MKVAIMQPYFLPYIGYFQLINAVELFIIYDNIKYTKKGWINRNRMLLKDRDVLFSLPLKGGSDALTVCQRTLAAGFNADTLLNQFKAAYKQAPYFEDTYLLLEQIVQYENINLFHFLYQSIIKISAYLGITTKFKISSGIDINHDLRNQHKVIALCKSVGASAYINPIGGIELYSKETFQEKGLDLKFLKPKLFEYPQFGKAFVPWLSIIDVMMFNSLRTIQTFLTTNYELI